MSLSPVCIAALLASRDLPNRCGCPRCADERKHEEALEYYQKNLNPNDVRIDEPFPEREK
uniref:Uncharacterized protein n=1 Tax=viral metagenome TaxID=1070528 RepID=A0A6H1Z9S8_9ZZZZ